MIKMTYAIREKESGHLVDYLDLREWAEGEIKDLEQRDRENGTYKPDNYEIELMDEDEAYKAFSMNLKEGIIK